MSILSINQVAQSFGAYDLFGGVTASVPDGAKIGLVGPNGVGKTTLLLILAGQQVPSKGTVHVSKGTQIGYLPQEASHAFAGQSHAVYDEMLTVFASVRQQADKLSVLEAEMADGDMSEELFEQYSKLQESFEAAGGYEYEIQIKRILTGLGFPEDRWDLSLAHLSGGQKTRVLLARLLLERPSFLILDEPTNHLDIAAVEWLEGMLKTWKGSVLIVSHDRYFLDRVTDTTWEMSPQGVEVYRGSYSAYVQQRGERWDRLQKEYVALREHIDKEMDFIRRNIAGQRTQMAQGKLSRLAREVEAITVGGLGMVSTLQSKGWARVSSELDLRRPAANVGELQQRIGEMPNPSRPPELHMTLKPSHRSGNIVLRTKGVTIGYDEGEPLFEAEDVQLMRQECAALIGANGTGKSTYLKTILETLPLLSGAITLGANVEMGYFAQAHEALNRENSVLDEFLRHHPMLTSEARNYLAQFLFRGDEVYSKVDSLSGGERGRLALSILALEKANLLLLDEPTNHLDIPAQETLQEALENYGGTILMVSHDRYLIDRLATQIWEVENGRLRLFNGSYQDYLAIRDGKTEPKAPEIVVQKTAVPSQNGRTKLSKNALRQLEEELARIEDEIHTAETSLSDISEAMAAATQTADVDKIQSLTLEYAATEAQLETLMEQWEKLSDERH